MNDQQTQAQFISDPSNTQVESDAATAIFNAFGKLGAEMPNENSYIKIINDAKVFLKTNIEDSQQSQ